MIVSRIRHDIRANRISVNVENGFHLVFKIFDKTGVRPVLGNLPTPVVTSIEIHSVARVVTSHVVGE